MIIQIKEDKKKYLDLLLMADEQEDMIDRYLDQGEMFVLIKEKQALAVCVVTDEGDGVREIKNLAVSPEERGKGYGRLMIEYVRSKYADTCRRILAGTGDSPLTLPFYKKCGFSESHRVKDFFTDHYDHPIFEGGKRLTDMVYLSWEYPED